MVLKKMLDGRKKKERESDPPDSAVSIDVIRL
jgi:hypothetical protein